MSIWTGIPGSGDLGLTGSLALKGPRPWVDVTHPDYGASPSASAAVNDAALAAAYAALPASGGDILIPIPGGTAPYDISATWVLGDGSSSAISTKRNIRVRGVGPGSSAAETVSSGAVRLRWTGASGGTMVKVEGPISGMIFDGIVLDCNDLANTGLDLMHPFNSEFRNLLTVRHRGFAYKISAYTDPVGCATGANDNVWINVKNLEGTSGTTAGGIQVGSTATGVGNKLDVARNTFIGCVFQRRADAAAASIELRFTDASTFISCMGFAIGGSAGDALRVSVPTGDANFPGGIVFYNSPLIGLKTVSGTWSASSSGMLFLPLQTGDDPTLPIHANFRGLTDAGRFFGSMYGTPFQWPATTNFSLSTTATEYLVAVGSGATSSTAAARSQKVVSALDLFRWTITLTAAPGGSASRTFTIFRNGVATAAAITITGAATTGSWSGTVSFAADDLIVIESAIAVATPAATSFSSGIRGREMAA